MQRNESVSDPDDFAQERGGRLWANKGTIKHRKYLTSRDLISVVHSEIVQLMSRRDNAFKHNIKPVLVRSIIRDYKRDSAYIDKKMQKESDELECIDKIRSEFDAAIAESDTPVTSRYLVEALRARHDIKISKPHVCRLMRKELGLSYK